MRPLVEKFLVRREQGWWAVQEPDAQRTFCSHPVSLGYVGALICTVGRRDAFYLGTGWRRHKDCGMDAMTPVF